MWETGKILRNPKNLWLKEQGSYTEQTCVPTGKISVPPHSPDTKH